MNTETKLTETSPELLEALGKTLSLTFGRESIMVEALNTGGGVVVARVDLSLDGRGMGRQLWLTREGDTEWQLGFYDFYADPADEGICVTLFTPKDRADNPLWIASQVAGILSRLGVTKLQGE